MISKIFQQTIKTYGSTTEVDGAKGLMIEPLKPVVTVVALATELSTIIVRVVFLVIGPLTPVANAVFLAIKLPTPIAG